MPDWLVNLEDKQLVIGDHLVYSFGEKTSFFGNEVEVKLDFGKARGYSDYESD